MEAYEFYATPENGTIVIPEQYRRRFTSGVKVTIQEQDQFNLGENKMHKRTDLLSPLSIDTRGWKFNKDEANER